MKCNQSRPGFELVSPCPFPTTITITPRAPPQLVGCVLWHINLCRLFNAKFIFMQIVLFQTIQFNISTQFNFQKHFHFKLFKQLYVIIQLNISTQFKCKYSLILNNVSISSYSVYSIHFSISILLVLFNP